MRYNVVFILTSDLFNTDFTVATLKSVVFHNFHQTLLVKSKYSKQHKKHTRTQSGRRILDEFLNYETVKRYPFWNRLSYSVLFGTQLHPTSYPIKLLGQRKSKKRKAKKQSMLQSVNFSNFFFFESVLISYVLQLEFVT